MRDTTEAADPEPRPVQVVVADLPCDLAFGFTTPEGERVCIVGSRAEKALSRARDNAHKTFWTLFGS